MSAHEQHTLTYVLLPPFGENKVYLLTLDSLLGFSTWTLS